MKESVISYKIIELITTHRVEKNDSKQEILWGPAN
jgi:hypothetical protein